MNDKSLFTGTGRRLALAEQKRKSELLFGKPSPKGKALEKSKDKRFKARTFGSDTTQQEKNESQNRFHRAWND